MITGIDHLVVVVPELESAIASYQQLGFTVVRGGKHPIGTHNALVAFADGSYIELIAFFDPGAVHPWKAALEKGGGLVDFCLQTDDLTRDVQAFRRAGVAMSDPMPLTRTRPDGFKLAWVLSLPPVENLGVTPFLIRDETPRGERVPRERTHAHGVSGIRGLIVAVRDARATAETFAGALSMAGAPAEQEDLHARGVRFAAGPHRIEFVSPIDDSGPVAAWIRDRGPSPYAASLAGPRRAGVLDMALAQGARLFLE